MPDLGMRRFPWTEATLVFLALFGHPAAGSAGTGRLLSQWMTRAPRIDGQLAAGEWSAATLVPTSNPDVTLRIGNDARTLYLAILDAGDLSTAGVDLVYLVFDDEGGVAPVLDDGAFANSICQQMPNLGEGNLGFGSFQDAWFEERLTGVTVCPGQSLADRMGYHTAPQPEGVTYEMAIPLDGPVPLRAGPGERFAFMLRVFRDGGLAACLPDCPVQDPPNFRNLILASGGCNTGPQSFNSGLPLDWTSLVFIGSGDGWQQSSLFGDPVFCQDNVTGGSGTSACAANVFYTAPFTEADLYMPLPVSGQSTATVRFLASLEQGAPSDTLVAAAILEDLSTQSLLGWQANHAGQPVEFQLDLLSPPYLGNLPVKLGFGHITTTLGGVEGGYAQIDDVELLCGPTLFADGFESGLTTHWSSDLP